MKTGRLGKGLTRSILGLTLFGIAFGQVEASVVVYLRTIAAPIRARAGVAPHEPLPLFDPSDLGAERPLMYIELAREAATLVMIGGAAWAATGNLPSWVAAFALAFGVWDLTFYLWLRLMIGWPASPGTWDLLFLLPVPWAAPVAAPVIVAISLAAGGAVALAREPRDVPRLSWILLLAGAAALLASFMWDWRHWVAGGMPRGFPWGIFAAGEALGIAGFLLGLRRAPESTTS